ncbi:hypothetical protein EJ04DRAFT_579926 [Polyplosphaeria fusca]|uniref:Uncharacterized protein n=1 Tax=Polyplosphaeria fusca TaxID=682080 RepID=A0A9P4QSP5_9PLEO|nr:hypothetical protein EJ04DRAFT_579926 [Polyplosphaeria fusca]
MSSSLLSTTQRPVPVHSGVFYGKHVLTAIRRVPAILSPGQTTAQSILPECPDDTFKWCSNLFGEPPGALNVNSTSPFFRKARDLLAVGDDKSAKLTALTTKLRDTNPEQASESLGKWEPREWNEESRSIALIADSDTKVTLISVLDSTHNPLHTVVSFLPKAAVTKDDTQLTPTHVPIEYWGGDGVTFHEQRREQFAGSILLAFLLSLLNSRLVIIALLFMLPSFTVAAPVSNTTTYAAPTIDNGNGIQTADWIHSGVVAGIAALFASGAFWFLGTRLVGIDGCKDKLPIIAVSCSLAFPMLMLKNSKSMGKDAAWVPFIMWYIAMPGYIHVMADHSFTRRHLTQFYCLAAVMTTILTCSIGSTTSSLDEAIAWLPAFAVLSVFVSSLLLRSFSWLCQCVGDALWAMTNWIRDMV